MLSVQYFFRNEFLTAHKNVFLWACLIHGPQTSEEYRGFRKGANFRIVLFSTFMLKSRRG
jgi:hypothetical protein